MTGIIAPFFGHEQLANMKRKLSKLLLALQLCITTLTRCAAKGAGGFGFCPDDRQEQLMKLLQENPEIKKKVLAALLAEDAQKSGC